jgi:hypothetical protein
MCGRSIANTMPRFWSRLLVPVVGVSLVIAMAACDSARQTTDTQPQARSTEPQPAKILDLVRPVGLMESLGTTIGEVTLSPAAEAYRPPTQVSVYRIKPVSPVTRQSMDALADQFDFVPGRRYDETWLQAPGRGLGFPRVDDVACYELQGGAGQWAPRLLTPEETAAMEAGLPFPQPPPLSSEEIRAITDAFLQKWGVDGDLTFIETFGPTGRAARYQAYVGGACLVGAGAKVYVMLDSEGNVTSFLHYAEQAVESDYAVTIRPLEAALADLKAGRGEVPPDITDKLAKNITVEGIEICYYAPPVMPGRMYYKPVYVFHVRMSDGTLGDWTLSAFEGSTAEGAI